MNLLIKLYWILGLCLLLFACSKEPVNPFDQQEEEEEVQDSTLIDPTTIAGLHALIFKPTCANSGCHDGTFEPDFRTISSTFNNLVYQPIIKNDPIGSFTYRVVPYQVDQSLLVARLTYDIDDNSGIMPLVVEANSDWEEKRAEHLQNLKAWINAGAPDDLGNVLELVNQLPEVVGVSGRGNNWLKRRNGSESPLEIPSADSSVELYFALTDEETPSQNLNNNHLKFSLDKNDFSSADSYPLTLMSDAIEREGLEGTTVRYYHKVTIQPSDFTSETDQVVYFRLYTQDDTNPLTEIPASGAVASLKDYFSFTLTE